MTKIQRIVLVGDSSMADNPPEIERRGWGHMLRLLFDPQRVDLQNFARNGRSSKSFITEGLWDQIKALIPRPNVVLIQIGANDLPGKGPERETIPGPVPDPLPTEGLGSQALDWFRLNITRFVEESRAMKALPLLATQPERHEFEAYSATPLCRNRRYAQAIRAVAADLHVPLLELDRYSLDLYARFGVMGAQAMHYIKPEGDVDHSHFNAMGASIYAEKVAEFLIDQVPVLATAYRKPATPTVAHLKPNHTVMESIIGKA